MKILPLLPLPPVADAGDDQLSAELEHHVRNDRAWSWLVVLALVFEAAVIWKYRHGTVEAILFIVADLAIAAGVYGEIHSGRKMKMIADELERRSKRRVAEANVRAAEANQKAEEARLELERYKAPRLLRPEQIDRIAKALTSFIGTEYIASVNQAHPEIMEFLGYVIAALEKAGWKQRAFPHSPAVKLGDDKPYVGTLAKNKSVLIAVQSEQPAASIPRIVQAGQALVDALVAEGVETTLDVWAGHSTGLGVSTIIEVLVGPKA